MQKFEFIDLASQEQERINQRLETQSRQMEMAWENMSRMERQARDLELYLDRYLPL